MKITNVYFRTISKGEFACLLGIIVGRVSYKPTAKYLYRILLMLFFVRLEICFTHGKLTPAEELALAS